MDKQKQIELMVTAKERYEKIAERHMADPKIRKMMARKAPGQP